MFALFAGECHYPAGGWDDCRGTFATIDEAKERFAEGTDPGEEYNSEFEWGHIVDLTTRTMVETWGIIQYSQRATKTRPAQPNTFGWLYR